MSTRIFKSTTILILAILSVACNKFLSLDPANERALKGYDDVKAMFSSYLYNMYVRPNPDTNYPRHFTADMILTLEAYSDNIDYEQALPIYMHPGNNSVVYEKEKTYANWLLYNDFKTPEHIWNNYYTHIGYFNTYIDVMADSDDCTPEQRHQLCGEIHIHRAFYFFKLLQFFAPYTSDKDGIPVYLHTGNEVVGIPMPRKSHTEVYQTILDDLHKAKAMLEETAPSSTFNVVYNERYLNNFLAEVYWFKAESPAKESTDYENVLQYAMQASAGIESSTPLTTIDLKKKLSGTYDETPNLFLAASNNFGSLSPIYGSPWGMEPTGMRFSKELLDILESEDIRYDVLIKPGSDGIMHTAEWPGGNLPSVSKKGTYYLFEIENAYLIAIEAHYRLGNESTALQMLNTFKSLRNAPPVDVSGESLLDEIVNERRKEFAGAREYRWLDLKRYGKTTINRTLHFFNQDRNILIEPNGYHYALPIPFRELQENPHISQNPGWVNNSWN